MPMRGDCKFVKQTIESIVQDLGDQFFLCIPHSDLSENIKDMVRSTAPDANIRFLDCNKITLAEALNLAVSSSKMEFILRIDSDDRIIKGRIQKQVQFLIQNGDTAVVGSQIVFIDENSNQISDSQYNTETLSQEFGFGCRIAHPSVMFRRSQILSVGNYLDVCNIQGKSICEDYDLWLRVLDRYKIQILNEHLTEYRVHDSQNTQRYEKLIFSCSLILRSRKILKSERTKLELEDLILDSDTYEHIFNQMRTLNTPESRTWLLDYSIMVIREFFKFNNQLSTSSRMKTRKKFNLYSFAFVYLLKNRGNYEKEIASFRDMVNSKNEIALLD